MPCQKIERATRVLPSIPGIPPPPIVIAYGAMTDCVTILYLGLPVLSILASSVEWTVAWNNVRWRSLIENLRCYCNENENQSIESYRTSPTEINCLIYEVSMPSPVFCLGVTSIMQPRCRSRQFSFYVVGGYWDQHYL